MDLQQTNTETGSAAVAPRFARRQMVKTDDIEKEILAGLPNQIGRMKDSYECLRYSMGRFEEYPTRHKDMRYRSPSVRRTSPIMKRIMEILTLHMYKTQPTRRLPDKLLSQWLEKIYKRNHMWPKLHRADQLSFVGGFVGFQFSGDYDPSCPVKIQLWGADQIAFWVDPDDPLDVAAVATLDMYDNQRRLRLYTRDEIVTYVTEKGAVHAAFGGAAFLYLKREPNPYRDIQGNGIIPFAFAHWTFPAQDFETNSPGLNCKELNQGINERLDNLGDSIYFNCHPIVVAEGVADGWVPPAEIRPGDIITLPAGDIDQGGNGPLPTLKFLMSDLNYITKDWEDQTFFLDHTLEMWNIPPALIRMVQSGARSGRSIQAEQTPIIDFVEMRRTEWSFYEDRIALKTFEVGAAWLRLQPGYEREAAQIQAMLDAWEFSMRWGQIYSILPGPERDQSDDWRLNHKQVSLIGIAQERADLTEDEALEMLIKAKAQSDQLAALGITYDPFGMGPVAPGVRLDKNGKPIASDPESESQNSLAAGDDDEGTRLGQISGKQDDELVTSWDT